MRCFVGIDLPKNLKKRIEKFAKELNNSSALYGKFVETENLHISLKFFGEVNNSFNFEELKRISMKPFTCSLENIGTFPNKNFIKVLWIGINKGSEEIKSIHESIEELFPSFPKDKEFIPHITISRIKNVSNKETLLEFFEKNKNLSFDEFTVNSFYLFESTLTQKGPIYEKIKKINLE